MARRSTLFALAGAGALLAAVAACAPAHDNSSTSATPSAKAATCAKDTLNLYTKGQLTIGTDKPAY